MRDCIFLVADKNMEAVFSGFLSRDQSHRSLGTGRFAFDPESDMIVDGAGADPGVFHRAHELLGPYLDSHRFAVVALDCSWQGSPGPAGIVRGITARMTASGWQENRFRVIAIDPEVEVWMWQDNVHVATALRYRGRADLRQHLRENDWWPEGALKPPSPKEAMEWLLRSTKRRRSSAVYREIASKISLRRCQDPALQQLVWALREWFPPSRPY